MDGERSSNNGHSAKLSAEDRSTEEIINDDRAIAVDDESVGDNADDDDNSSAASYGSAEVEEDRAASLSFYQFCYRLEKIWEQRAGNTKKNKKQKVTNEMKLRYILPPAMIQKIEPQSIFPLLRLLIPNEDNARIGIRMKEKAIAKTYCEAWGFPKGTSKFEMLHDFTRHVDLPPGVAGDLSRVVEHVISERTSSKRSNCTIGDINSFLDELLGLPRKRQNLAKNNKKTKTLATMRAEWLIKVKKRNLCPLEHKWLVRIILRDMQLGMGMKSIVEWYGAKYGMELYSSHNSLKNLCTTLADPEYFKIRYREEQKERELMKQEAAELNIGLWSPQNTAADVGQASTPMCCVRTTMAKCMTSIHGNHDEYLKTALHSPVPLALQFPVFCAEVKLDGERMVVHVENSRRVTMHTRKCKWYSELYSPVIGPAIRRAMSKYKVDAILDGEMEAWDNGRQQLISFGSNRTVANYRRDYMRHHNLLESHDKNLHPQESIDPNMMVMRVADEFRWIKQASDSHEADEAGKHCWLQYVVFDILYVGGPDVNRLLSDCGMEHLVDSQNSRSIIDLTLMERKQILYQLLEEQTHEIEICPTRVIRPNGDSMDGREYFSTVNPPRDCGRYLATRLDSTHESIRGTSLEQEGASRTETLEDVDRKRRAGKTKTEIHSLRSQAVESFYKLVVEQHRMEGLVLKDLASPYLFGDESRRRKFWHKYKPEFDNLDIVPDVDVVILGASYATGLSHSGQLSSFLCGIVDSKNRSTFMTFTNVNGKSKEWKYLDLILKETGFQKATKDNELQLGKWFVMDEEGALPDFISPRSLQTDLQDENSGWKYNKAKHYPDVWIRPEDSIVLTIKGQELVISDELSAGLSMRFARIQKIRIDEIDGGEKSPFEVADEQEVWSIYGENIMKRNQEGKLGGGKTATEAGGMPTVCRFLTPEEYGRKLKKRKRRMPAGSPSTKVPKVESKESYALEGVVVVVLEGRYRLDPQSREARESKQQGWFDIARNVSSKEDIMEFVQKHGGTISATADIVVDDDEEEGDTTASRCRTLIVGGSRSDPRVETYMQGINRARSKSLGKATSKKARTLQQIGAIKGIVRWTFLISCVRRFLEEQASTKAIEQPQHGHAGNDESHFTIARGGRPSILNLSPSMLRLRKADYLALNDVDEGATDAVFDPSSTDEITLVDLELGLDEIERNRHAASVSTDSIPWQVLGVDALSPEHRWILADRFSKLWPQRDRVESSLHAHVVMYPDLFEGDEFGTLSEAIANKEAMATGTNKRSRRWEVIEGLSTGSNPGEIRISSCIPLARTMGALLTPHLHQGVTHILCDLLEGTESIKYDATNLENDKHMFRRPERLESLSHRINEIALRANSTQTIQLVSPSWVRSKWASA